MAIGHVEKQFGKGSIMRMGERVDMAIESVPTGAMALDLALGVGGLPRGRIVELQARLMSQALRKLTGTLSRSTTIAIFINQLREKIGGVYGSPEVTPGGRALKFYSSVRLDIRRIESIKDGGEVIGNRTRVKVVKNKCSPPFKSAEFDIMYGRGISREGSVIDVAVDLGIVKKSGAWYTYEGEQLGQGRENAKQFLPEKAESMGRLPGRV